MLKCRGQWGQRRSHVAVSATSAMQSGHKLADLASFHPQPPICQGLHIVLSVSSWKLLWGVCGCSRCEDAAQGEQQHRRHAASCTANRHQPPLLPHLAEDVDDAAPKPTLPHIAAKVVVIGLHLLCMAWAQTIFARGAAQLGSAAANQLDGTPLLARLTTRCPSTTR